MAFVKELWNSNQAGWHGEGYVQELQVRRDGLDWSVEVVWSYIRSQTRLHYV